MEHCIKTKRLILGMVRTNCYIAYLEHTKKAVIIDPADNAEKIIKVLSELSLCPEAVLLTHGHFDHMLAADRLRREYQIPVCVLETEQELLADPYKNESAEFTQPYQMTADNVLQDGQTLPYLDGALEVFATPGHTAGSCCYYAAKSGIVFSGDTLFKGTVGRTDLPTAMPEKISVSIREKLFVLPEDTIVLCGHGFDTTIGKEKHGNPYVI